jgi:hypothetical protein
MRISRHSEIHLYQHCGSKQLSRPYSLLTIDTKANSSTQMYLPFILTSNLLSVEPTALPFSISRWTFVQAFLVLGATTLMLVSFQEAMGNLWGRVRKKSSEGGHGLVELLFGIMHQIRSLQGNVQELLSSPRRGEDLPR